MQRYADDLTDSQWQFIKNIVDNGRKRKNPMREMVNAILYFTKVGANGEYCQLALPYGKKSIIISGSGNSMD